MSKAIKAKIDNPDMSLYEALLVGGFSFAQRQGTKDIDVRDSDGISSKQVSLSITVYNVIDRVARNGFFFRLFSHTLQTNCDISMPKKNFQRKNSLCRRLRFEKEKNGKAEEKGVPSTNGSNGTGGKHRGSSSGDLDEILDIELDRFDAYE